MADKTGIIRLTRVAHVRGLRLTRASEDARLAHEAAASVLDTAQQALARQEALVDEARGMFVADPACGQAKLWLEHSNAQMGSRADAVIEAEEEVEVAVEARAVAVRAVALTVSISAVARFRTIAPVAAITFTRSMPSPPRMLVSRLSIFRVSFPSPPDRVSRPNPPVSVSRPRPPVKESLPAPPESESFMFPPLSPQIKYFLSASKALVFAVFLFAIVPNPIVKLSLVLTLLDCF